MKDEKGDVIYVGKAKDLKARTSNYFTKGGDGRAQVQFLIKRVREIENIVTDSEEQAFILERDLITKYKPRYNIRLKDDKAYLSVRIDENSPWPRLELVRRVEHDGAKYFGPYTYSYELRTILEVIKRVVPLRTCTDTVFYNRQRPCLEYQIKRCAGPCCLEVDREQYQEWVSQAISILNGKTETLEKELETLMQQASEELRFEDAALYRDRIEALQNAKKNQRLVSSGTEDRDVFALYREERLAALSILQVRNGRVSHNKNFSFSEVEVSDEEIVESVIEQYYQEGRDIPEELILPFELENEGFLKALLKERRGRVVSLSVPQRGLKARLRGLAEVNAKQHFLTTFNTEDRYIEIATALSKKIGLSQIPRRIECIDISNFQGSDIVGAVVVFYDGSPDKSRYKRYRISQQEKPDDFASIYEVVFRRLKRCMQENEFPDLIIIDGGPGQLSMALKARDELKLGLDIVSLAKIRTEQKSTSSTPEKKPERIYTEGNSEAIKLDAASELTHFIQRVRDEAHRFVISYHRSSRKKRVFSSKLDGISGVGPERKRRLLNHFGSVKKIAAASPEEVAKVGRMSKLLAMKILDSLREN